MRSVEMNILDLDYKIHAVDSKYTILLKEFMELKNEFEKLKQENESFKKEINKKNKEVLDTCKGYYEQIEKTDLIKDCKKKLCLVNYRTKTIKQMIAIVKKLQVETHLTRGELSGGKDKNPAIQALLDLGILSWEARAVPRATNPSLYKRVRYYFLSKNYYQKCIDIGILKEPRKS